MKFIDLFAGVGGFRIAFENLGNECVFSSEINSSCRKVYKTNFGQSPYGDIKEINARDIPDFDILTAGFPCQPFSLCGKKEGFKDKTRGTLFFDIVEILKVKQPQMILLENVKGIVTHDKGNTLNIINQALNELGYTIYTKVLNTHDFGLPQHRQRWYCVGFLKPIHFEFPIGNKKGSTLKEVVDVHHYDEELLFPQKELDMIDFHFAHYKETPRVQHSNSHCSPKSKKSKHGIYSFLKTDNCLRFHTGDKAKSQIQDDYYVSLSSVAPTLIATRAPKMWDLKRHLSVLECKKLQGFSDNYDFSDVSVKIAKKQLGNSITIPVVKAIASNMFYYYKKSL